MDLNSKPEAKLISLIFRINILSESLDSDLELECHSNAKIISLITQTISLVNSIDFDSQPRSELMSLTNQAICLFHSMDLDSQPDPLRMLISLISQKMSLINSKDLDSEKDSEFMVLIEESFSLEPQPELISLIRQILCHVVPINTKREPEFVPDLEAKPELELKPKPKPEPEIKPGPEPELISLITELISTRMEFLLDISLISRIISLVSSMDFDSQPETEFLSLITQTVLFFNTMNLDDQPDPLRNLISLISQKNSHVPRIPWNLQGELDQNFTKKFDSDTEFLELDSNSDTDSDTECLELDSDTDTESVPEFLKLDSNPAIDSDTKCLELDSNPDTDSAVTEFSELVLYPYKDSDLMSLVTQTLSLEPEPEFISFIYQIFSLVISMNSKWKKLIFLCPQVQVELGKENFHVIEEVSCSSNDKWKCLPFNWKTFSLTKEDVTHIRCESCNGENHGEYEKALLEIKHTLHPKHSLQLVLKKRDVTRECYCCDKDLKEVFYYCSACNYAMNIACIEKPRVLSVDLPKWHEHTLAQFPRKTSLTCNVCALTHSSCPFYICPPCDFVVHQKCIGLPRVIRISRHFHRIYFTPSFDQGVRCCGVCRRKIDNDYGCYSCKKDDCSYAVHSKCATQRNVWDGKELEGEPEEDIKEVEPFVTVRDGIIRHFSHRHHHLRLDENTGRDYDENKLCQACITPIYFGNFYLCMQCDFVLHEECAKLSRKIYHPIHPHLLTLVGRSDHLVMDATKSCSVCPWRCTAGFFYECSERECRFKVHVQCATISEPLVHGSHSHPLFLTSKPGEERRCGVCKELGHCSTNETFNCIECDFALCFKCATLPQKVRYKHDKHTLTLSYGEKTSTMAYWCEVCEEKLNPKERFYMCDWYCCNTLHIECMLGVDLYMQPGSSWLYCSNKVSVLPNNHRMSRPICSSCEKRCPHKIIFQCFGLIMCSTSCVRVMEFREVTK